MASKKAKAAGRAVSAEVRRQRTFGSRGVRKFLGKPTGPTIGRAR